MAVDGMMRLRILITVWLPGKEMMTVKRNKLIGGIGLLVLAALIFLFLETSTSTPAAITLMVAGIALIAASRRARNN